MTEDEQVSDYDVLAYPSGVYNQTHPDRLATVARLFGLEAPPIATARVLELGCGDALNLISLGYILPGAEFVGIDLAKKPIAKGQSILAQAGMQNVHLQCADVLKLDHTLGEFDYIIAHGLYSWVPQEVRNGFMRLCQRSLTPNGVAYVSYNAYPGNHFRDLARGIMQFHIRQFDDPETQISQARSVLQFIAGSQPDPGLYRLVIEKQLARVNDYIDQGFYHDDLSQQNQPFYFYQFIEHAEAHGLQYLGEAEYGDMREESYLQKTEAMLRQLSGNLIAKEQYLDLLRNRAFRQTLICRSEASLDRSSPASRVQKLHAGAHLTQESGNYHAGPKGGIETGNAVDQYVLNQLGARWPESVAVEELLRTAGQEFDGKEEEVSAGTIATLLLHGYENGLVTLHTLPPPCTKTVTERPRASHLARTLAAETSLVPTLRHRAMRLDDPMSRFLVSLLDGENDHHAIFRRLASFAKQGNGEGSIDPEVFQEQLQDNLQNLAQTAILEPDSFRAQR